MIAKLSSLLSSRATPAAVTAPVPAPAPTAPPSRASVTAVFAPERMRGLVSQYGSGVHPHDDVDVDRAAESLKQVLMFADRDDYLAWVATWKAAYREVAAERRAQNTALAAPHRYPECARLMMARASSKARARTLLVLRRAGKRLAAAQRSANRGAGPATA